MQHNKTCKQEYWLANMTKIYLLVLTEAYGVEEGENMGRWKRELAVDSRDALLSVHSLSIHWCDWFVIIKSTGIELLQPPQCINSVFPILHTHTNGSSRKQNSHIKTTTKHLYSGTNTCSHWQLIVSFYQVSGGPFYRGGSDVID